MDGENEVTLNLANLRWGQMSGSGGSQARIFGQLRSCSTLGGDVVVVVVICESDGSEMPELDLAGPAVLGVDVPASSWSSSISSSSSSSSSSSAGLLVDAGGGCGRGSASTFLLLREVGGFDDVAMVSAWTRAPARLSHSRNFCSYSSCALPCLRCSASKSDFASFSHVSHMIGIYNAYMTERNNLYRDLR